MATRLYGGLQKTPIVKRKTTGGLIIPGNTDLNNKKTGQNLGIFDSPESANAYGQPLYEEQGNKYGAGAIPIGSDMSINMNQGEIPEIQLSMTRNLGLPEPDSIAHPKSRAGSNNIMRGQSTELLTNQASSNDIASSSQPADSNVGVNDEITPMKPAPLRPGLSEMTSDIGNSLDIARLGITNFLRGNQDYPSTLTDEGLEQGYESALGIPSEGADKAQTPKAPTPSDKAIDNVIGKDSSGVADWLKTVGKVGLGIAAAPFAAVGQRLQDVANLPPQELAPLLRGMQRALKPTPPRFGIPYFAGETFGTAASESLGGYLDERQKQQELALAMQKQEQAQKVQEAQIKEHEAKAKAWGEGRGLQTGTETWYNKITDKYMTLPKGVQAPEGFVPTAGLQQVSGAQKAQQQGEAIPIITKVDVELKQAKIDSLKKQGTKPKWKTPDGSPIFAGSSGFYTINDSGENISYKGQIEPIVGRPMSRKFNEIKLANPDLSDKEVHEKGLQEQRDMIKFGREETAKNQFSRLAYDTETKSPVQVTARQMNDANKDDPNRILTLNKQTSDIVAKGLFLNEIDTGIKNIDTSINGMAKENPSGISDSLRVAMKTVMSKDTPGLMREAVNTVVKGELAKKMTQSEQDYLISHARLAENAMALRGVLGIGNQSAVDIRDKIMNTLPDVTKAADWDYMRRQSSALKSVLDIAKDNSILIRRKNNANKQNITENKFKEILNSYRVDGEQGTSTQLLDELNSQGIYVNPSEDK